MAKTKEEVIYESLKTIEEWAVAGVSEKEMAKMLDMSYSTFREQKRKISALSALLKKCADERKQILEGQVKEVEGSLLKRALGYEVEEERAIKLKKEKFTEGGQKYVEEEVETVTEKKHIPADINAVKFFLLNRAKVDWKNDPDRLDIEKKRLRNDTKRTKIAEVSANRDNGDSGQLLEDVLEMEGE